MEKISRVETFPNLVASKEPATVYDVACKSIPELVYLIMQRLNETIEHMNKNDATLQQQLDYVLAQLEDFYLKFDEDLRQEIQIVLQAWIEDGTLEQVISQLVENRAVYPSVAALQQAPNIFQLGAIVELQGYHYAGDGAGHKRIIADVDDGSGVAVGNKFANVIRTGTYKSNIFDEFHELVAWAEEDSKIEIVSDVVIRAQAITDKSLVINGNGHTITTTLEGVDALIKINGKRAIVSNVRFDLALKSRGAVHFTNCEFAKVENSYTTGYSKEFGYYQTDSAFLFTNCKKAISESNTFENFGYQYGEALGELNRCLTFQGDNSIEAHVINTSFDSVNQAVVANTKKVFVSNSHFTKVKDNSLYLLGCDLAKITNNVFDDKHDESIVLSGGDYIIRNNTFSDVPNKYIAISGDTKRILVDANTFNSKLTTGNVINVRNTTYKVDTFIFTNNTVDMQKLSNTDYQFYLGTVDRVVFENNELTMKLNAYQRIIKIVLANKTVSIKDNLFANIGTTSDPLVLDAVFADDYIATFYENNLLTKCRLTVPKNIQTSTAYYRADLKYIIGFKADRAHLTLTSATLPATNDGFRIGDILRKPDSDRRSILEYVVHSLSPFELTPISTGSCLKRSGTPINWIAPEFVGQLALDTSNNDLYVGFGLAATEWKKINS